MKIVSPLLFLFFILPVLTSAQKDKKGEEQEAVNPNFPYKVDHRVKFRPDTIPLESRVQFAFREPVEEPEFIYGKQEMEQFFVKVAPEVDKPKVKSLQDSVRVQFLVGSRGEITDVALEDELREDCQAEVIRMVSITEGLWEFDSTRLVPDTVFLSVPLKICWKCYSKNEEESKIKSLVELRLSPRRYNQLGLEKTREGKDKLAVLFFDEAIRLDPTFVDAYFNRGVAKFNSDDNAGACADWLRGTYMGDPKSDLYQQQYCQ